MFLEDKANGESLDGFIEFLGTKPRDEIYEWSNSSECACGQYLKSIGRFDKRWLTNRDDTMGQLNCIAAGDLEMGVGYKGSNWTFGSCLDRAKKVKEAA